MFYNQGGRKRKHVSPLTLNYPLTGLKVKKKERKEGRKKKCRQKHSLVYPPYLSVSFQFIKSKIKFQLIS